MHHFPVHSTASNLPPCAPWLPLWTIFHSASFFFSLLPWMVDSALPPTTVGAHMFILDCLAPVCGGRNLDQKPVSILFDWWKMLANRDTFSLILYIFCGLMMGCVAAWGFFVGDRKIFKTFYLLFFSPWPCKTANIFLINPTSVVYNHSRVEVYSRRMIKKALNPLQLESVVENLTEVDWNIKCSVRVSRSNLDSK